MSTQKTIQVVGITDQRFAAYMQANDESVLRHYQSTQAMSRKRLFKRQFQTNCYRVTRSESAITLHFMLDKGDGNPPKNTAIYQILPFPRFA